MMYELLGGEKAYMQNVMKLQFRRRFYRRWHCRAPGMYHGMDGSTDRSTWQQIIPVSEDARQMMFDNVKREFIKENGISNGNTTKGLKYSDNINSSVKKEDRAKGTWTLQQYEGNYRSALYHAVKAADPNWEAGQPFDTKILDNITREDIEKI